MPRSSSGGSSSLHHPRRRIRGGEQDEARSFASPSGWRASSRERAGRGSHPPIGEENSRAKTFPVRWGRRPGGGASRQPRPRLRSSCRPRPTATTASAPASADSRAITTASPGAVVSGSGRGDRAPTGTRGPRSIRFTAFGPRRDCRSPRSFVAIIGYLRYASLFQAGSRSDRPYVAHRGASDRALENVPGRDLPCRHRKRRHDRVRTSACRPTASPSFSTTTARGGRRRRTWPSARTPAARLRTVRLKNGEKPPISRRRAEIVGGAVPDQHRIESVRRDRGGVEGAIEGGVRRGSFSCRRAARECLAAAGPFAPRSRAGWSPAHVGVGSRLLPPARSLLDPPDRRLLTVLRLRKVAASGVPPCRTRSTTGEGVRAAPAGRRRRRLLQPAQTAARSVAPSLAYRPSSSPRWTLRRVDRRGRLAGTRGDEEGPCRGT